MDIEKLKTKFPDYLFPCKFAVYIFPNKNFANFEEFGIGMLCHETEFPGLTYNTSEFNLNNRKRAAVYSVDYDPLAMTFYCDRHNRVLEFFELWSKQIKGDDGRFGYFDDYIAQIEIEVIDKLGQPAAVATLYEAYPVNINPITLSYGDTGSIMSVQVSFKYTHWTKEYIKRPTQNASITVSPNGVGTPGGEKTSGMYAGSYQNMFDWKNFISLGNVRRGINMISKIKSYRRIIEKPNIFDIASGTNRIIKKVNPFGKSGINTNTAAGVGSGTDGNSLPNAKTSGSAREAAENLSSRASKIFSKTKTISKIF